MDVSVMSRVFTNDFEVLAARTFGFDPAQLFLLALGICVLTIIMISTRNRIRRSQSSSRPSVMERYAELRDERGATRDLEAVMMELDQLSRQIHGRLDTKLARLDVLIRDADQRIDKLARLQRASAGESTIDVTLEPEAPGRPADPPPPAEPNSHEAVYRFADSGLKPVEIASELGRNTGEIELILSLRRAKSQTG